MTLCLLQKGGEGAKASLGTFAFFIKGRRASPPAGPMKQQGEAQRVTFRPTSPDKAQRSKIKGLPDSPSQPVKYGDQSKESTPKFQVLLVEDNLVNRTDFPPAFNLYALTVY